MKKIIVIVGPTGVGKTKLSIMLAKKYDGEIINADSMQIYKHLDIGTAKVTESEKEGIRHYLLDYKDVVEDYSIYDYQIDCRKIIKKIQNRGKTVIIVGGTGLYIKSALYDYKLDKVNNAANYDSFDTELLYNRLLEIDKKSALKIGPNNRVRIINALNYYDNNSKSIVDNKTDKLLYDVCFIGLETNRDCLYSIINERVDIMINNGLVDEVKSFYDKGIFSKPLLNGIGYKELYQYFRGDISLDDAINCIKKNSRHYAKRQFTFFKNQMPVKWFNVDYNNFNNTYVDVINYIDNF
ncbi:MAG: tRNA (adenosine(37)-N6)-dimethylallyltransferase MiaA [Bacilli bacterium]|nr:tRNA (adenosine(37)-N6)-dimethylallyltransferase MiaA [Bacilli bacterium]